jgi:transposase-like protein
MPKNRRRPQYPEAFKAQAVQLGARQAFRL